MVNEKVTVYDKVGLHARTASIFSKAAAKYNSDIQVIFGDKKANGKSMLSLMTLGVKSGHEIEITATGEDEEFAVSDLVNLIHANFGIEE